VRDRTVGGTHGQSCCIAIPASIGYLAQGLVLFHQRQALDTAQLDPAGVRIQFDKKGWRH
jgi:hypothetical protein